jgi:hypothetical protein
MFDDAVMTDEENEVLAILVMWASRFNSISNWSLCICSLELNDYEKQLLIEMGYLTTRSNKTLRHPYYTKKFNQLMKFYSL